MSDGQSCALLGARAAMVVQNADTLLVLNIGGVDDSSAQQLYVRHVYSWRDIRWVHRYKDITSVSPQGRFLLDYSKFDEVVAQE
jgi:inward rectifier potassium channel